MICTQTQQQLSLRDPVKGSWQSVLPSPCTSLEKKDGSLLIQPQDTPICTIADDMCPNATITVIARPRKGSWQSVLPSPCPLGGSPGGKPRKVSPVTISVFFLRGSLRRATFFAAKESGERNRQRGPISRRSPLGSLPDDEGGSAPFEPQRGTGDGRPGTGDGGYGLPQPVTSVTGFAMTRICCLVLRLYAGARCGVAMSRICCLVLSLYAKARRGVALLRFHCLVL